jgi:hypothetical protein
VVVPESDDDLIASSGLPPTRPWVSMDTLRATHHSATQAFNTRQLNVLVGFAEGRYTLPSPSGPFPCGVRLCSTVVVLTDPDI